MFVCYQIEHPDKYVFVWASLHSKGNMADSHEFVDVSKFFQLNSGIGVQTER